MKVKKLLPFLLIVILLIAAASYTVFIVPMQEQMVPEYTEAAVVRGSLQVGITESGYLEYTTHSIDYDLDLNVESDEEEDEESEEETQKYLNIEEIYVAQGQLVQEGEPLLKFSAESISQVRRKLESALVDAKVEYNEAESEYRLAVLEAENNLEMQQTSAKYAKDLYQASQSAIEDAIVAQQLKISQYTEQTAELETAVAEAGEEYQEAKVTYEEKLEAYTAQGTEHIPNYLALRELYENAKSAYERAESTWEQAQNQLTNNVEQIAEANETLAQLKAKKKIEKMEAEQTYEETVLSGENAGYSYEASIESLEEDLKEVQEKKTSLEEKLAAFEGLVGEEGILYAPATGRISQVSYSEGDDLERTGILFSYILAEDMTISVDVTQEDVVSLAVGDKVVIEFAAYEGKSFEGTIYSIDTTATSQDTPTISYTIVVNVIGTLEELYGGMSADITFVTEVKEDALYITRKALVEKEGKYYVYVNNSLGEKELQEVTVGMRNESSVEILSGLEEGDRIFIETLVKASK